MFGEEVGLLLRQVEPGGDRQAVVREEQTLAVGEDVLEVAVQMEEPAGVHEGGPGLKLPHHHAACPLSRLVVGFDLYVQPVVQVLRDVLQEQRDARRSVPDRLDPVAHLRAASPVGDDLLHVGQFPGQCLPGVRQHPPVVHQREALMVLCEHPVRRHGVHGQLPPGPPARTSGNPEAGMAERR